MPTKEKDTVEIGNVLIQGDEIDNETALFDYETSYDFGGIDRPTNAVFENGHNDVAPAISLIKGVSVRCNTLDEFSYIGYHADLLYKHFYKSNLSEFSFINLLKLVNESEYVLENIRICFNFSNPIFKCNDILISILEHHRTLNLKCPNLIVDMDKLLKLQAKTPVMFEIAVYSNEDNKLIYKSNKDYIFTCLPISQPSNEILKDERLFAKYITPQSSTVKQISLDALKFIKRKKLVAYQNNDIVDLVNEAKALYDAISDYNIAYQNPPANDVLIQKIRTPQEVISQKKATCVDMALLYASSLEEIGIHSIVILTDDHCYTGFFVSEDDTFQNGILKEAGVIASMVGEQINKVVLVETTGMLLGCKDSFVGAMDRGRINLTTYGGASFTAIDVRKCQLGIYSPVVTDGCDTVLSNLVEETVIDEKIDPIFSATFNDISHEKEMDKFMYWEHKLLDLSEANQLINMKINAQNTVKIISENPFYDIIAANNAIKLEIADPKIRTKEFQDGLFRTPNLKPSTYDKTLRTDLIYALSSDETLKSIIKRSDAATDETGAPTLYLCFGLLSFKRAKSEKRANCPFMILPVKATQEKNSKNYTLNYDFDNILLNETFFEYYKSINPNSDYSSIYDISVDYSYKDIFNTFKKYCTDDIVLEPNLFYLSNLTFSNFILWLDVRKRQEELKKNKAIESFILSENKLEKLDDEVVDCYNDLAAPLSFDSTQVKAIDACSKGKSFILDGPPGTGKSQTIVNMIVNAFYHGKTVLFVAEKKAALDVVADRLKSINLDRFCLELHSNKTSKKSFFGKLGEVMDKESLLESNDYDKLCNNISSQMNNITKKLNKLHNKKYFLSLYDAIVDYEELKDSNTCVPVHGTILQKFTDAKYRHLMNILNDIVNLAAELPEFDESLLKNVGSLKLSYNEKEDFNTLMSELLELLKSTCDKYYQLTKPLEISYANSAKEMDILARLYELAFTEVIYASNLPDIMSVENEEGLQEVYALAKELSELKAKRGEAFDFTRLGKVKYEAILAELDEASFFKKFKIYKKLKHYVNDDYKVKKNELRDYFLDIKKYNELTAQISSKDEFIKKVSGVDLALNPERYQDVERSYELTKEYIELLKSLKSSDFTTASGYFIDIYEKKPAQARMAYFAFKEDYNKYKEQLALAVEKYTILYSDVEDSDVKVLIDLFEILADPDEYNHVIMMTSINYALNKLAGTGFEILAKKLRKNELSYTKLVDTVDYSLAYGYIKQYFKDDEINYFNSAIITSEIDEYKKLINEYSDLVVTETAHRITSKLDENQAPLGQLKKYIASGGRGISIRDTLASYDSIIRGYFPCFLMSPLSAAQYLAIDEKDKKGSSKFDIVIFDEASQIPTHEAIGAIARGNSLIVAGDPEQMPPSAYFNTSIEMADDLIRFEDSASLLDDCLAIDLPRIRLCYHYRSRHESLISFSNQNFYNSGLYTFPSPSSNAHIIFRHVELKEKKLKSNITPEEIDGILDTVKKIYSDPKNSKKSLGIIVFNVTQAEKLSEKMGVMLAHNRELAQILEDNPNPYFIKSLENVQGDERDFIILSVGFRVNDREKAVVLGPIARDHGERRLNVAITRAKESMYIVSTIKASNFDTDDNITNKGTLLLKHFLGFAENQTKYIKNTSDKDRNIAKYIKADLEELGYDVDLEIGSSRFKVDLAIKNAETGNYDLGVIIDNSYTEGNESLRDAVYLKSAVFNGLHWNLVDVYSLDYYKDKKAVIDNIIKGLRKNDEAHIQDTSIELKHLKEDEFKYATIEYKEYTSKARIGYDSVKGFDKNLPQAIKSIISIESPVSFNTIKQRIKVAAGMQKMSEKAQMSLRKELMNYPYVTYEGDQVFYWKDSYKNVIKFRNAYDRDIYDIPNEEIICCMLQIIDIEGNIQKDDLYRLTLEALGYQAGVLSKKNYERLDIPYNMLAASTENEKQ